MFNFGFIDRGVRY